MKFKSILTQKKIERALNGELNIEKKSGLPGKFPILKIKFPKSKFPNNKIKF